MDESSPSREQRPAHRPPEPPAQAPSLPPSGAAFDNHAYQHDTTGEDTNHNLTASESFGINGSTNGTRPYDKEPYEAVNLELINLAPKNGQNGQTKDVSHKKDVEVDMPSNHYDEYFVPVNEHKKSLRGEKLYVMADKRGKGGCRKRLCWVLGALLLLGAVLIAVLAATGVFSNSNTATPVDQYNSSISSARAFAGISTGFEQSEHKNNADEHPNYQTNSYQDHEHTDHNHAHTDHGHNPHNHTDHNPDQTEHYHDLSDASHDNSENNNYHIGHDDEGITENVHGNEELGFDHNEDGLKEPSSEPVPKDSDTTTQLPIHTETIRTQELGEDTQPEHVHTTIVDQTGINDHVVTTYIEDDSVYVPRTVEGVLKIDNEQFQPEMLDETSSTFRQLSSTLTHAIAQAIFDDQRVETDNDIVIEIVNLRPGSLIVTYRIHWKPKSDRIDVPDPITTDILKSRLSSYLERNGRMLNVYHVSEELLEAKRVLDLCQDESNGCEYGCEFDEVLLDFKCTCPEDKVPDMLNPKTCVHPLDNSLYQRIDQHKIENEPEFKVLNVSDESEPIRTTGIEEPMPFDWLGGETYTSEPITERMSDTDHSHIFGSLNNAEKIHVQSNTQASPEPLPEPTSFTPESEPKQGPVEKIADITTESLLKNNAVLYNYDNNNNTETHLRDSTVIPRTELSEEQGSIYGTNTGDNAATEYALTSEPTPKPITEQSSSITTESLNTETLWSVRPTWMHEMEKIAGSEQQSELSERPESTPGIFETPSEPKIESKTSDESESKTTESESKTSDESESKTTESESKTTVEITTETEYTYAPITELQESTNETPFEDPKTDTIPELDSTEVVTTESTLELKSKLKNNISRESNTEFNNKSDETSDFEQVQQHASDIIDDKVVALAESIYQHKQKPLNTSTESKEVSNEYNSKNQDISDSDTIHSSTELMTSPERFENSEYNSSKDSQRQIVFSAAGRNQFDKEMTERNTNKGPVNTRNTSIVESELEDISSKEANNQRLDEGRNLKFAQKNEVALSGTEDSDSYSDEATTVLEGMVNNTTSTKSSEVGNSNFVFSLNDLKPVTDLAFQKNEEKNDDRLDTSSQSEENNSSSLNSNTEISTVTDLIDGVTKAFVAISPKSTIISVKSASDSFHVTSENPIATNSIIHDFINDTMESSTTDDDWLTSISGKNNDGDIDDSTTELSTIDANEHEQNMDSLDTDYLINSSDREKFEMPLYGIPVDYDTANNRGKRIENSKPTENVTMIIKDKILPTEKMIADYIYNNSHIPGNNAEKVVDIITNNEEPAPVWEQAEIEPEKVFYNEEGTNEFSTETPTVNNSSTSPKIPLEYTLGSHKSNLNVTVYEVPTNYTKLSKGEYSGEPKPEQEEHNSEMNPFLPEIENNKSLVKKLHEGQDIELPNINDTQNEPYLEEKQSKEYKTVNATVDLLKESESSVLEENAEENSKSLMKIENTVSENKSVTMKDYGAIEQLNVLTRNETSKSPISSFLEDVSDLVPSKEWTTTENTVNQNLRPNNEMSAITAVRENPLDVNSTTVRTVSSIHDVFEMELKTNAPTIDQSFSEENDSNDPLSVISIKSAKKIDKKAANDFLQKKNEKSAKFQENNFNDISDDSENGRTLDFSHYNPSSNSEQQ